MAGKPGEWQGVGCSTGDTKQRRVAASRNRNNQQKSIYDLATRENRSMSSTLKYKQSPQTANWLQGIIALCTVEVEDKIRRLTQLPLSKIETTQYTDK